MASVQAGMSVVLPQWQMGRHNHWATLADGRRVTAVRTPAQSWQPAEAGAGQWVDVVWAVASPHGKG
jgi:hypothetical protein